MAEAHVIYGLPIPEEFWQRVHEMDLSTVPKDWVDSHIGLEDSAELCSDNVVDALIEDVFAEIDSSYGDDPLYFGIEIGCMESPFRYTEIPQVTNDEINEVMRMWDELPSFIQTLMGDIEFDVHIILVG